MRSRISLSFVTAVVLLAGCAAWQAAAPRAPETPRQALLQTMRYYEAAILALGDMKRAGVLPEKIEDRARDAFTEIDAALQIALMAVDEDPATAQTQVQIASRALSEVRRLLSTVNP